MARAAPAPRCVLGPSFDICIQRNDDYLLMMLRRYSIVTEMALFAAAPVFPTGAQAPIAGSGALPQMNPLAQSPPNVIEAVGKLMPIRLDRGEMHGFKGCFRRSRLQATM